MADVVASPEPVAPAPSAPSLAREVEDLGPDAVLVDSGEYVAFAAEAASIPRVVYEIGRLRELTFRAVGEGTGHALDLDAFDSHYLHLVLWNRDRSEVVGAYRCGATD